MHIQSLGTAAPVAERTGRSVQQCERLRLGDRLAVLRQHVLCVLWVCYRDRGVPCWYLDVGEYCMYTIKRRLVPQVGSLLHLLSGAASALYSRVPNINCWQICF